MAFLPSLTGLAFLAGLAWLIRTLRRAETEDEVGRSHEHRRVNRQGTLSADALAMLIELEPVPYYIIDVRESHLATRDPAPEMLKGGKGPFMSIAVTDLRRLFLRRGSGEFAQRFPGTRYPNKEDLIVFVADDIDESKQAVEVAQSVGLPCAVYLESGLSSLQDFEPNKSDVRFLSRHAVAVLLGTADSFSPIESTVIDVRRADEHVVFGTIENTKQLAVSELPKALKMDDDEFTEKYQFPKPKQDDVLVMSCRTNKRATWASQILCDAGFSNVFVHRTGVFGWQFSSSVKKYDSYEKGNEFPKAIPFEVESPDRNTGLRELADAGLTSRGKLGTDSRTSSSI